jgi:MoaA/NifB/PqqE/SkfB family radical SAM enzyme
MTIDEWMAGLRSVREFLGCFTIQFDGGEPFIKKGFVDLLQFCSDEGIAAGVITNGACFTPRMAQRVVAARVMNIDISVDSADAHIHDTARGVAGSLEVIQRGIGYLRAEKSRQGVSFPLRIKPTVHALNCGSLPGLVDWAVRVGATSIDFQPVRRAWVPPPREIDEELWIGPDRMDALERSIATLIQMKQDGAPIETPVNLLEQMPAHFRGRTVTPSVSPCRAGMQIFRIAADGQVTSCGEHGSLGNLRTQSARDLWYGEAGRRIREQTVACQKGCAFSCTVAKSLPDLANRALIFLKGAND